jgi:hypothetical protein
VAERVVVEEVPEMVVVVEVVPEMVVVVVAQLQQQQVAVEAAVGVEYRLDYLSVVVVVAQLQQQQVAVGVEYRLDYLSKSVGYRQLQLLAVVVGLDDGHDDGVDPDLDDGYFLLDAGHAELLTSVVRLHALRDQCLFQHLHPGWPLRHRERHQHASGAED